MNQVGIKKWFALLSFSTSPFNSLVHVPCFKDYIYLLHAECSFAVAI